MKIYYEIVEDKLVAVSTPTKRHPFFFYSSLVIVGIFLTVCGALFAMQKYGVPQNSVVLTQEEYERYADLDHILEETLQSDDVSIQEYVLSFAQLQVVFDHVFSDIQLTNEVKARYLNAVSKWSAQYSMPPLLILSIIWRESSFDASTVSTANARGPMQVIYKYHAEKLSRINKGEQDLHDIEIGIRVGVEIMREYFDKYNRNIFRAMLAYVGGTHRTYAQDILTRYFDARIYIEEHLSAEPV